MNQQSDNNRFEHKLGRSFVNPGYDKPLVRIEQYGYQLDLSIQKLANNGYTRITIVRIKNQNLRVSVTGKQLADLAGESDSMGMTNADFIRFDLLELLMTLIEELHRFGKIDDKQYRRALWLRENHLNKIEKGICQ